MTVSQIHESLGSFSIKLKSNIPRDVLDQIEYFGHVAVIPGRMDARTYGDGALDSARYVGVLRKKKIADNGQKSEDTAGTNVTLEGVGMNFWLGDEDDKGAVIEDEIAFTSVNFTAAVSGLLPPAVTAGTIGGVSGTYSGIHQWQTPRKAIQYVCDTMSQPADPNNLLSDANSSFEATGGVSGWTNASNCNIAVTGAYSYLGTKSMWVTPTTVGAMTTKTNGTANAATVVEGTTYIASMWVLPTGVSCYARVGVDYRTSGGTFVSSAADDTWLALPQNAWTQVSRTITVPTGGSITKADFLCNLTSNASADRFAVDNVWYFASTSATPVSFRVNNRGALDAGLESSLFVTTPQAILVRQGSLQGEDLRIKAVPGTIGLDQDLEDFATRLVVLGSSDGIQFNVGSADIGTIAPGVNIYKDIHGNPLKMTRMVSESQTSETNADTRAELALREVLNTHREISLSTNDFDIYGSFDIGDYVYCYDPDGNLIDNANEVTVRGIRVNPMKLQVTELEWPVTDSYSVAYRAADGTWYDLTDYLDAEEERAVKVVIGDFQRTLNNDLQSVASRLGTNTAPDNSTPGQVSFTVGSFQTVTYLDNTGLAKAQQKLVWATPVNADLSAITDGAYYELQYKLNTGHLYSQTWGAVSTLLWNQMNTWGQPVQATNVDWDTRTIQWGTNTLVLNDLAAGTAYDFRIRAVDNSNNLGAWSAVEIVTTAEDDIPPSQPAAPTVAASLIAVQVTSFLGLSSGGTYNLEKDLAYLEVHAEYEPGFTPSNTTKLGNLLANQGMMSAQTPAVGTFPISNTTAVYVKLVAVDRSGNRSSPSVASMVTATLIDDSHISSLTVSKITAGEVTADWIVSGSIKTAAEGQRVELNQNGFQAYSLEGDLTTNLSSDPSISGQFISFVGTGGTTLAQINSQGKGSFTEVNTDRLVIEGIDLMTDIINPRPKGVVAYGYSLTNVQASTINVDYGYMELAFTAEANRMYKLFATCDMESDADIGYDRHQFVMRDGGADTPTTSSPIIATTFSRGVDKAAINNTNTFSDMRTYTPGVHRILWCFSNRVSIATLLGADGPAQMWVEDMGDVSLFQNTGYLNDGQGTSTAPEGAGNYTKVYYPEWSRSYAGDNNYRENNAVNDRMYQGRYDSNYGQQKSLIGFDGNVIQSNLVGAVIKKVEVFLYAAHWYNDYGTALIGTHNISSAPGSWNDGNVNQNRVSEVDWSISSGQWISLDVATIGAELQNGTTSGISLGPTTSTDHEFYGWFVGADGSNNEPKLRISYTI